jgi:hypothetical protein
VMQPPPPTHRDAEPRDAAEASHDIICRGINNARLNGFVSSTSPNVLARIISNYSIKKGSATQMIATVKFHVLSLSEVDGGRYVAL